MRRPDRWLTFLQVLKWIGFVQGAIFGILAIGFAVNTVSAGDLGVLRLRGSQGASHYAQDDEF